jgi:hypothetical protein
MLDIAFRSIAAEPVGRRSQQMGCGAGLRDGSASIAGVERCR